MGWCIVTAIGWPTIWVFIAFALSHGAIVGHQGAQSWAHLLRSHHQNLGPRLSSRVLSVWIWKHMKHTPQYSSLRLTVVNQSCLICVRPHHGRRWPELPVDPHPHGAGWRAGVSLMGEDPVSGRLCSPSHDLDPSLGLCPCLSFDCQEIWKTPPQILSQMEKIVKSWRKVNQINTQTELCLKRPPSPPGTPSLSSSFQHFETLDSSWKRQITTVIILLFTDIEI